MDVSHIYIFFLYEIKLEHNAAEAVTNINKAFGDDTVKECTIQEYILIQKWLQKFCSSDMNLENELY